MNINEFVQKVQMAILAVFSVLVMSSAGWAATYYVDAKNGNDFNIGTSETAPWKAISKVNNSSFQPGDYILFKRGEVWREHLIIPSSGSEGNPITFGAYGTASKPIISGANLVRDWEQAISGKNNIWGAMITKEPKLCYFDGSRGKVEASINDLDSDNEWYWNSGILYVYSASDPDTKYTNPGIEAGYREHCIAGLGKRYVIIKNIQVTKASLSSIFANGGKNWTVYACTMTETGEDGSSFNQASIRFHECSDSTASNNTITDVYGDGIYTYNTSNITISGNTINRCHGSVSDCIHLDTITTFEVANNACDQENAVTDKGCIITEGGSGGIIEYNTTAYAGNGISVSTDNTTIRYNTMHDHHRNGGMWSKGDNLIWSYNISYSNAFGAWVKSGSINTVFYNNVIFNATICGLKKLSGGSGMFKNNIIWCSNPSDLVYQINIEGASWTSNNNVIGPEAEGFISYGGNKYNTFADYSSSEFQDQNSISDNPLLTDPSNHDFTLQSFSPCIDSGVGVSLFHDIHGILIPQGTAVDIGAFEYFDYEELSPPRNFRIYLIGKMIAKSI